MNYPLWEHFPGISFYLPNYLPTLQSFPGINFQNIQQHLRIKNRSLQYAIPKYHSNPHILACEMNYPLSEHSPDMEPHIG